MFQRTLSRANSLQFCLRSFRYPFLNVFHLLAKITRTIILQRLIILVHHVRHSSDAKNSLRFD